MEFLGLVVSAVRIKGGQSAFIRINGGNVDMGLPSCKTHDLHQVFGLGAAWQETETGQSPPSNNANWVHA
jgi:hypothetical protein